MFRVAVCLVAQLVVCGAGLMLATASATAGEKLSPQIRDVIDGARFLHAHWGLLVADRRTGEVLYERDADKLFPPASTTKLYSVSAALDALGSNFCFETPVFRRGTVDASGVLNGDLILVAVGDLTLGGRTTKANEIEYTKADHTYANPAGNAVLTAGDPLAGLNTLAHQVAAAGVREVRGQVIIDAGAFAPASGTGSGPSRLTPIMVNDNLIDFTITPTVKGARHGRLAAEVGRACRRRAGRHDCSGRPIGDRLPPGGRRPFRRARPDRGRSPPVRLRERSGRPGSLGSNALHRSARAGRRPCLGFALRL